MKTKLTILSIAIAALLGVGMLMAFKQEEKHKKYLTATFASKAVMIVDEKGGIEERKLSNNIYYKNGIIDLTKELNNISAKGYTLISTASNSSIDGNVLIYTFEKE